MLSGKAVARAVPLNDIATSHMFDLSVPKVFED